MGKNADKKIMSANEYFSNSAPKDEPKKDNKAKKETITTTRTLRKFLKFGK